jgi:hypothetical protein
MQAVQLRSENHIIHMLVLDNGKVQVSRYFREHRLYHHYKTSVVSKKVANRYFKKVKKNAKEITKFL